MRTCKFLCLLQALANFCLAIEMFASSYTLIIGEESDILLEAGCSTIFHICSMDETCTHVIRYRTTKEYKMAKDKTEIENLKEEAVVWEKVAIKKPIKTEMSSCKTLKQNGRTSGLYDIQLPSGIHQVYCDMDTNGGGYTFLSNDSVSRINQSDIDFLLTDNQDVLLRILKSNGSQPYTVIQQYNDTGGLSVQYSNYVNYTKPNNDAMSAYIFVGTLPASFARNNDNQGFISNDIPLYFQNCAKNPNNYFAFFSKRRQVSLRSRAGSLGVRWRETALQDAQENMSPDFFLFTEIHYGGCGLYSESVMWADTSAPAIGTALGIR
ncbi:uncharacterized protein LOC135688015 isoform X2 [Rhopilema esculentum]|uniref:uncharacterized protein LOC135688015 isoform X2 n=1 Tax=Rhopilema esculentum TaxID=499914 RepID=UPI0031D6778C